MSNCENSKDNAGDIGAGGGWHTIRGWVTVSVDEYRVTIYAGTVYAYVLYILSCSQLPMLPKRQRQE